MVCHRFVLLVAIIAGIPNAARAAAAADRIVIESYDGARPTDAADTLARVYEGLERRGYERGDSVAVAIRAGVSGEPGLLGASQVIDAQHGVDTAYQRLIDGEYEAAIAAADKALDLYRSAPGHLSREAALRDLRFKALLIAARSSEALERGEDAFGLMAEAIRSFPDRTVSPTQFDPRLVALHRRVKDELTRQGSGSIEIRVDDASAVIFVDEQFVGTGTAKVERALPGRYRIYVAKAAIPGRVHEVDVAPGEAVALSVPWQIDGTLRTAPGYVGLELARGAPPDAEVDTAIDLGRALGARHVVVLSLRKIDGRRAIVGYSLGIESRNKVFGAVQIEPIAPSGEMLDRLAALLAGEKVDAGTLITTEPIWEPIFDAPKGLGRRRTISLAVGGGALISSGLALALYLSSKSTYEESTLEPDDHRQDALYESSERKYKASQGFAIAGAALATGAVILWVTGAQHPTERAALTVAPTQGGASLVVLGRF